MGVTRPSSTTTYTYDKAQNRTRVVTAAGNSAPVANNDSVSVSTGAAVSFNPLSNDTDADSDAFFLTSVSGWNTSKGSVSYTANCLRTAATCVTYAANSGASGTDSFTYAVSDGKGGTATGTITVTINAAVAPPVTSASTTTVVGNYAGSSNSYPLSLNISGGTPTSLTITSAPPSSAGTASVSGTSIFFTPANNYTGQTSLQYTASNAGGTSSPATATITVTPSAGAPVARDDNITVPPGTGITFQPKNNDTGSGLRITAATQPSIGRVAFDDDNIWVGDMGAGGFNTSFQYTITDNSGRSSTATVNVTAATSPPPVANNDSITVPYGSGITFQPKNNDTGSGLRITGATQPSVGRTAFDDDNIWVGDMGAGGFNTSFQYTITDNSGRTSTATVSVTAASNPNPPPVANNDSIIVPYGSGITFQPKNNDTGAGLRITGATQPSVGRTAFDEDNIWVGDMGAGGFNTSFQYTITDNSGQTSSATVNVAAAANPNTPNNTAPVANDDRLGGLSVGESENVLVLENDTDADGDALTITSISTTNGSKAYYGNNGSSIEVTAKAKGSETITYTISDGRGGTATGMLTVTVVRF
ncbi:Ig-like domain-containing protein [Caulobacter segnis]|uniref:Ig-like domain-containing protein n=1 Tax=Caulobacter segnis TaxID=88688 RepID=UPI00385771FC